MEISGGSVLDEARVTQWDYLGYDNQKFLLQDAGSGYYRITPRHAPSKCLEVYGWSQDNEARVVQYEYYGNPNQQWSITNRGNGYYSIINRHSNKALEVFDWDRGNDARMVQWGFLGNPNQLWSLAPIRAGQRGTVAAVPGQKEGSAISVFPNPAGRNVQIDLGEVAPWATVEVLASTGKSLLKKEFQRRSLLTLDLESISASGLVLLRITTNQKSETRKIVLSR